jgi:hypothetical protein
VGTKKYDFLLIITASTSQSGMLQDSRFDLAMVSQNLFPSFTGVDLE